MVFFSPRASGDEERETRSLETNVHGPILNTSPQRCPPPLPSPLPLPPPQKHQLQGTPNPLWRKGGTGTGGELKMGTILDWNKGRKRVSTSRTQSAILLLHMVPKGSLTPSWYDRQGEGGRGRKERREGGEGGEQNVTSYALKRSSQRHKPERFHPENDTRHR